MNITRCNFWRPQGSRKDCLYPDSINLVNCVWLLFTWMVFRWTEKTNNLSRGSLKFFDKIKKKFLDHNSDVNFSFSNFENFLIVAFTVHVRVMSEGIDVMFAQGHHHGFEFCVCACMHARTLMHMCTHC